MVEFHAQRRSNDTSVVPGVSFHKSKRQPLGLWQARIHFSDGRRRVKSFSVFKFGNDEPYRRAVASRAEQLAMVEDRRFLRSEAAVQLSR